MRTPDPSVNPSNRQMFVMTFESAAARDAYLPHPLHEAFKAKHGPFLEKVFVMDI